MASFTVVATEFANYYYQTFASNRAALANLYRNNSTLIFERSDMVIGVNAITEKLTSLPFEKLQHKISTLDAQPVGDQGNIFVLVTGLLLIDDSEHPQQYSQAFHLVAENGSYYVLNDIFRLIYAA